MDRERIEAVAQWVVISALAALGLAYAGDYLYVRERIARGANSGGILGSVTVQRYWEIPQKNGKVEYSFDAPAEQACIHSIFPHGGYTPCWYLSRRKMVRMSLERDHDSFHAADRIRAATAEAGRVPKV